MTKRKFPDPMSHVSSGEMKRRIPYLPYSSIAAMGDLELVEAAQAQRLATEMSGVTALSVIAAGASGYGLARLFDRNRGEAIQAALVGWFGSFAIHYVYHALKR